MSQLIIPLPNGGSLRCEEGTNHKWGDSVSICDENGNEIVMWTSDEFAEDAESVIGAMFAAALTPIPELLKQLNRTYLVDGCWH